MIRVRQIKINVLEDNIELIKKKASKKLNIPPYLIKNIKINKQSIDARHKPEILYIYEVDITVDNEKSIISKCRSNDVLLSPVEEYKLNVTGMDEGKITIIGAGPAGLSCAYILAENGYKPLIIERGKMVDERVEDVENFFKTGQLNINSNVQFGEGGAGTFSDGKLNTLVKDKEYRCKHIFEIFVKCGAPKDIMYTAKPHIGTDILREVVKNMRKDIIKMGGTFRFDTCLTNIEIKDDKVTSITVNNDEIIKTDALVLAIGHSARDTFEMINSKGVEITSKPFAMGIRIQHSQSIINKSQYGVEEHKTLLNASYKLTHQAKNKRGVYTFCMCPGGFVVNSSSEKGLLAINGMSNHDRKSGNANSAIIVTINNEDFGNNPLDGIEFQRKLEKLAYEVGKGSIPIQTYKDFKNNVKTSNLGNIKPIFKGEYTLSNIREILPIYMTDAIIEAIEAFSLKIKGYNNDNCILAAIESRTSSPIKIIRDEKFESNIKGLFPCGEGAGYAGGITSACMDGMKIAEILATKFKRN